MKHTLFVVSRHTILLNVAPADHRVSFTHTPMPFCMFSNSATANLKPNQIDPTPSYTRMCTYSGSAVANYIISWLTGAADDDNDMCCSLCYKYLKMRGYTLINISAIINICTCMRALEDFAFYCYLKIIIDVQIMYCVLFFKLCLCDKMLFSIFLFVSRSKSISLAYITLFKNVSLNPSCITKKSY